MSIAHELEGAVVTETTTSAQHRVPVDVINLQWVYAHFPLAWEFKGGKWLPELSQISFRKGLNGQSDDGNTSAHKNHITSKGGTIIEPSNARLGQYRNYLRAFPAFLAASKQPGTYFGSMFESPTVIGGRHAKWNTNTAAYDAFRLFLVEKGIIERIDTSVIRAKIDERQGLIEHLKSLPSNQLRSERIVALEKMIEQMEQTLTAAEDAADQEIPVGSVEIQEEPSTPKAPRRRPGS